MSLLFASNKLKRGVNVGRNLDISIFFLVNHVRPYTLLMLIKISEWFWWRYIPFYQLRMWPFMVVSIFQSPSFIFLWEWQAKAEYLPNSQQADCIDTVIGKYEINSDVTKALYHWTKKKSFSSDKSIVKHGPTWWTSRLGKLHYLIKSHWWTIQRHIHACIFCIAFFSHCWKICVQNAICLCYKLRNFLASEKGNKGDIIQTDIAWAIKFHYIYISVPPSTK